MLVGFTKRQKNVNRYAILPLLGQRSHKRSLTDLERIALRNRIKIRLSQLQLDQETSCDPPYRQGQKSEGKVKNTAEGKYERSEHMNMTELK